MSSQRQYRFPGGFPEFDDDNNSLSDPFSTPPFPNHFPIPAGSPTSFHSAKESLATEVNPFEAEFTLALAAANHTPNPFDDPPTHSPSSSGTGSGSETGTTGTDPLAGSFDPDATRLFISQSTFEDPFSDPTSDDPTTSNSPAHPPPPLSHGHGHGHGDGNEDGNGNDNEDEDEDEWAWVSAFEPSSPNAASECSECSEWEVRDVTPRESWPLKTLDRALDRAQSLLCRMRDLESGYGPGYVGAGDAGAVGGVGGVGGVGDVGDVGDVGGEEEVYEGVGDAEDCVAPGRLGGFRAGARPRVSGLGRRLPVVVETGASGKAESDTGCLAVKVKSD